MNETNCGNKYKNTEIGVIAVDWKLKSYGDVFNFLTSATYSRAKLTENDEVQYVHYGDIHTKWNFFLDFNKHTLPTVAPNQVKEYSQIKDGDIIMADASEDYEGIGKSVEVVNIKNNKVISGLHTFLLRDTQNQIANGFKAYIHKNQLVKAQFDKLATGMKVYGVSRNNLKTVQIPLPPTRQEQTAIATALSDTDALIEILEKLIKKKWNIKLGVMQELLQPKDDWKERSIFQMAENKKEFFDDGDWIESEHITDKGVRLIQTGNIGTGVFVEKENKKFIYEESFKKLGCKLLKVGDLLICRLAEPAGRACIFPCVGDDNAITSVDVTIYRPSQDVNREFLNQIFTTNNWFSLVSELCGGTTRKRISRGALGRIKIKLPNNEEQNKIAAILSDMNLEIQALENKMEKYRKVKQGMMQVLLTGKIRLV